MIFVIKGSGPKIDESDLGIKQDSPLSCNSLDGGRGGRNIPIIGESLIGVAD